MSKSRPKKYNHISFQQKLILRRLILKDSMSVKNAARLLSINYSTAKSIMLFFRSLSFPSLAPRNSGLHAVTALTSSNQISLVQVVSTVGEVNWMKDPQETLKQSPVKLQSYF